MRKKDERQEGYDSLPPETDEEVGPIADEDRYENRASVHPENDPGARWYRRR